MCIRRAGTAKRHDAMKMAGLDRRGGTPPASGFRRVPRRCTGVIWTALPSLIYFNLPLDVIEAMVYGREWQLGYDKLPPLPWWLGGSRLPRVRHRRLALCALPGAGDRRLHRGVADRAAAGRRGRRARRGPDHRRHALLHLQRDQAQPQRDRAAALGAGRLCVSRRAAARKGRLLDFAGGGDRARLVGQIFHGGAGRAVCAVSHFRSRRAPPRSPGPARGSRRGARSP